jgi:hypothetical protein
LSIVKQASGFAVQEAKSTIAVALKIFPIDFDVMCIDTSC